MTVVQQSSVARPPRPSVHGATVADLMITEPKVLPTALTVAAARSAFEDDHVVMLLLTDGRSLVGTLLREDLAPDVGPSAPALPLARTAGRTIPPTEPAAAAHQRLHATGDRRLAVVEDDGRLVGLLCLNRRRDGFCSDAGVAARARAGPPRPARSPGTSSS